MDLFNTIQTEGAKTRERRNDIITLFKKFIAHRLHETGYRLKMRLGTRCNLKDILFDN